jgi:hypothetical protein
MQFGVRSAPVSRSLVAPGPSDPSPALTMAGATKKITTANPSDDEVKTERLAESSYSHFIRDHDAGYVGSKNFKFDAV